MKGEEFAPPETPYMNASPIMFDGCAQSFIATQAPKENSFKHFWHMVVQEKVILISSVLHSSFLGVCDRDDHQAGGEEQEEGSPVLA